MRQGKHILWLIFIFCLVYKAEARNEVVQFQRLPFSLWDIRLLDSPFKKAMELDKAWLLRIDADKLLSGYRTEVGLKPKATKYGGWESSGLSGHSLGHYLSALSMMYASTSDVLLLNKIEYILDELEICQQKSNGMLAGFPNASSLFSDLKNGKIYSQGFDLNGYWVPIYNLHKLFAGLIDTYYYTNNVKSLKILKFLSSWWVDILSGLNNNQLQEILFCEPGGINESMADVFAITGDKKYLDYAERLNHKVLLEPLLSKKDSLCGMHANTQIPKILGVIREYELTGKNDYFKIADFFWNIVVKHHTYVIGGNSESEHFGRPGDLSNSITAMTAENCNTYNMLKLTKHLYMLDASLDKVEYCERALFNQILGSQHPISGMVRYFSPMVKGYSTKEFSDPENSFWCCVGSGWENHARYGEQIYFKDLQDNLYVNLYIPSVLDWKEKDVEVKQLSDFLESGNVSLVVKSKKEQRFNIFLRIPQWANNFKVRINGVDYEPKIKNGYIRLNKLWNNNDVIELNLSLDVYSESISGDSSVSAFLYGPFVLNAVMPSDSLINAVVFDKECFESLVNKKNNSFSIQIATGEEVPMIPYYKSYNNIGAIYFRCFSSKQWNEAKKTLQINKMNQIELEKRTIDVIHLGEMQPERDHNFQSVDAEVGIMNEKKFRKAIKNGYFSFDMKVSPNIPMTLLCTYWGNLPHGHTFDIYVDGMKIKTETIHHKGYSFFDEKYNIPIEITQGKHNVTVSFRPIDDGFIAGPVFKCSMIVNQ